MNPTATARLVRAPRGTVITTAETGEFADPRPAPLVVGMMIGPVYRLRVTNIPNQEGLEVFPTIEVINRLSAGPGGTGERAPR